MTIEGSSPGPPRAFRFVEDGERREDEKEDPDSGSDLPRDLAPGWMRVAQGLFSRWWRM